MDNNTTSMKIIDEICKEKGIEVKFLSFGWIRELKKDGKTRHLVRNNFDLNTSACKEIVDDKYATYEILKSKEIPVLQYDIVFNPSIRVGFGANFKEEVKRLLEKYDKKVVIKTSNSSEGKGVFLAENEEQAILIVKDLFENKEPSITISPFEDIECEYRAVYLDGEILFLYKKIRNENNWKHNLANGAEPIEVLDADENKEKVLEIAKKAGKAVNARFVTVDISKTTDNRLFVMEINGCVCMSKFAEKFPNGYKITKEIYEKALDAMF